MDHGKTFIPAKQIILRERDGSIDFNKQIRIGTYTNYYAANQRVRQLIGEYSDVCYDITFADGYHLTGSIDLEPKSFWDGNGSGNEPLSWHLKTFWTNVSKITLPYPDMTREDIDEAKTLIEKYQLSAAQETLPDFTKRTDFYMHDATPAMNERTATRLIEIAQLGMTEVGVAEFGIEDVMSGLYIERVWRDSPEQWNDYIEWVKEVKELKGLHKANLPANAAARQLVIDGKEVKSLYGFLYESFSEGNCIDTKEFNELLMLSLGQSCVINGMTIKRIGEKEIKPEIGELPAKNIVRYFEVYRQYLQDNGLDDDSNSITVESLIDFVENEIEKD